MNNLSLQCSPMKKYSPDLPKKLNDAVYQEFIKISRVIHLSDYEESIQLNSLTSYPISAFDHNSVWADYGLKILWFATSGNPDDHNYYGNVAFEIAFNDVKNYFGNDFRVYYIEYIEYASSISCRILITRKTLERLIQMGTNILKCHDITGMDQKNMPVYFYDKSYMVAVNKGNDQIKHGYKVEFLIDCEGNDLRWFYQNCHKVAVNHSQANQFKEGTRQYRPYSCHKHNNRSTIWKEVCPTAFTKEQTFPILATLERSLHEN